jgi:hypothetical protein
MVAIREEIPECCNCDDDIVIESVEFITIDREDDYAPEDCIPLWAEIGMGAGMAMGFVAVLVGVTQLFWN